MILSSEVMRRKLFFFVVFIFIPVFLYAQDSSKRILIFGDSITAGYGINKENAFPALIQEKIDSLDWNFKVINGGSSGETSAGGVRRIDWMLRQPVDVFILELGGNDGLRGVDLESTKKNLQIIIDKVKEKYPDARIILAGMQVPPNLGPEYTKQFREMYPELAEENDVELIPFLLQDVGGYDELNLSDGIHPNEKGHKIVAETVWDKLKPILEKMRNQGS